MAYVNVQDVTERLVQLRARGDEASLEEASRVEREYEKEAGDAALAPATVAPSDPNVPVQDVAQPPLPGSPPPVTEPPSGASRRGFTSEAAELAAAEAGYTAEQLAEQLGKGSGKGGAFTVADVKRADR